MEIASHSDRSYSYRNTSSEMDGPQINIKGPTFTIHEEDSNMDLSSVKDYSLRHKNNNMNKSRSSNYINSPIDDPS